MFHSAYVAVQKHFRLGPWYHEADMRTGRATYWQLTSLQSFWLGLQAINLIMSSSSSMCGKNLESYQRGICWTIRCFIPLKNTIHYALSLLSQRSTYIKLLKVSKVLLSSYFRFTDIIMAKRGRVVVGYTRTGTSAIEVLFSQLLFTYNSVSVNTLGIHLLYILVTLSSTYVL
ncbi:Glycosyl hydrolase family 47 protein [Trifolium repens]|nr:Glycosyl hydrolase family 47 protein [Trifolium repens]